MVSYVWFKLITCRSLVLIAAYLDIILQKIESTPSEPNSGVIGVIDGRHKKIRVPEKKPEVYINRKKVDSLNVQVVQKHKQDKMYNLLITTITNNNDYYY